MRDFFLGDVFSSQADVIVVPFSTTGSYSSSFEGGLNFHNIRIPQKLKPYELGDIVVRRTNSKTNTKYIVLACSVDNNSSSNYAAIREIAIRLSQWARQMRDVREIACPILGSGAGNLSAFECHNIIVRAFYENQLETNISLELYTPEKKIFDEFETRSLDLDSSSASIALIASLERVKNDGAIEKIINSEEFYFNLAKLKFQELISYTNNGPNFYDKVLDNFKKSNLNYQEYLEIVRVQDEPEYPFLKLCGELIAYIDYNAYNKREWNKYNDKRVLAKSGVNQNNWFINLVKFKAGTFDSISSTNVLNGLVYLDDPYLNLNILSEKHRSMIFGSIVPFTSAKQMVPEIFKYFSSIGIEAKNPINNGALYSKILYHPHIKPLWFIKNNNQTFSVGYEEGHQQAYELIINCLYEANTTLDLGNCGLSNLDHFPELFECTHLRVLVLSNQWAEFEHGKWREKRSKNKGTRNALLGIPKEIKNLKNLESLICGGDWREENRSWNRWLLHDYQSILSLTSLKYLNLSNNQILKIGDLSKLKNLEILHLNNNSIHTIYDMSGMYNLKELYISNNKINNVDFLNKVVGLDTLDLHANQIRDLRPIETLITKIGIENTKWRTHTINIAKNPLEQPPIQTVITGKDAVLRYFEDIRSGDTYINRDVKFILMGNSEAGKSTLAKYINHSKDLHKPHKPTHWMQEIVVKDRYQIESIGEKCVIRLFDFGGHDYFHDTHHLFFGVNTIYILLWETATNHLKLRETRQKDDSGKEIEIITQDYPNRYWLDSVRHFTREKESDNFDFEIANKVEYNSRLLVVQNKVRSANDIRFLNNENEKENYPFIYDFLNISILEKTRNLEHFDEVVTEMLNENQIVGIKLPLFYKKVKEKLQTYNGDKILNMQGFHNYCNSIPGISIDLDQARFLASFLRQIGIVLWFPSETGEDRIYIHKKWVIDNIYRALKGLKDQRGEFDFKDMQTKLPEMEQSDINALIDIMVEFKMIFQHPHSQRYIAPLYLPEKPSSAISLFLRQKEIPKRRFQYAGFIHKHVLLSLFQRYGKMLIAKEREALPDQYYYWKNGLIIKDDITEEIVMIKFYLGNNEGCAHIDLYSIGKPEKSDGQLVGEVAEFIRVINEGYDMEEMATLDGEEFIGLEVLKIMGERGRFEFSEQKREDLGKTTKEQKIFKLKDYEKYMTGQIKKKKVVISYSKKDDKRINTFIRYLQPLIDNDLIEKPWYCSDLYAGTEWDDEIKGHFDEADVVFFMVSDHFYSTDYIKRHEIERSIDRYDKDKSVKIVPIILVPYDWARKHPYNLQRFSAQPYQAKAISDYKDENLAWHMVTSCIKLMIEKDMDPGKEGGIGRELKELYERQVEGKLDNNS
jgi:internalin A